MALYDKVYPVLLAQVSSLPDFVMLVIDGFKQGSVVVQYTLVLAHNSSATGAVFAASMNAIVASGNLSSINVSSSSVVQVVGKSLPV